MREYSLSADDSLFLEVLRRGLTGDGTSLQEQLSIQSWRALFRTADQHLLLPVVFDVVRKTGTFLWIEEEGDISAKRLLTQARQRATDQVISQYERTAAFLDIYEYLMDHGIRPLVIKGFVCRQTYPYPEYRQSWDEDLLISTEEFEKCHQALLKYGMQLESSEYEVSHSYEVIYRDLTSDLVIEVHKSLFPEDSAAYGDINHYFTDVFESAVPLTVDEDTVWTMDPDRHLFYLICHTFKHFLHFGAGMRQLTDILMYAMQYRDQIHWDKIRNRCIEIRADRFVAGIFAIGERYLGISAADASMPEDWLAQASDVDTLLKDVLDAGMQANTSMSRIHSSSITLDAVASQKEGRPEETSVWKNLFPSYDSMVSRYPYLSKTPFLLPAAWAHRICRYGLETLGEGEKNNTEETLRIGNERIALLQSQGILDASKSTDKAKSTKRSDALSTVIHTWSNSKLCKSKNIDKTHAELSGSVKDFGNNILSGKAAPFASTLWKGLFFAQWTVLRSVWALNGYHMPGPKEREAVRRNVTFIFKSFERKDMAIGLYHNIQKFYPGVRVIIADDSRIPLEYAAPFLQVIHLPFNSGLSRGISAALKEVRTLYVMRMDDDELLTRRTNLGRQLLFLAKHTDVDIVTFGFITVMNHHPEKAVWPTYYKTTMADAPKKLKIRHMTRLDDNHVVLGKGPNIFLARTDSVRRVGYDENIRMIDHHDFFRRAAGEVVSVGAIDSFVFHRHNPFDKEYQKYRSDLKADTEYLTRKYR